MEDLNLRRATVEAPNKLAFPEGRHRFRLRTSAKEGKRENGLSYSDHMNDVDHMITVSAYHALREQCLSGLCALAAQSPRERCPRTLASDGSPYVSRGALSHLGTK